MNTNPERPEVERLRAEHTQDAIEARIRSATRHSYLGDGVLGAIDGTITTFAIVAAASGAGFSTGIAIVFGFANVCADGLSMAASNYLNVKSERQIVERTRAVEEHHIDTVPEGERAEVREIFRAKGFDGDTLDRIVDVITEDRKRWLDTMLTEEHGLQLETPQPLRAGVTTFVAFLSAGLVPLVVLWACQSFVWSTVATAATFVSIGVLKARVLGGSMLREGLEALLVGGSAAVVAYAIAALTKGMA